jgi:ribose transport system ATP-binding protein
VRGLAAGRLQPSSFALRRGEILGVAGLSGSGQRELVRALFGDLPVRSGTMSLDGQPYRPHGPSAAWQAGVAYVPRERRSEGLMLSRPIFENVTLAHLRTLSLGGSLLTPRSERRLADRLGAEVRLRSTGPRQLAQELSGGNQQKVVFARALGGNPKLLLLDEPTRGVDVGAKFDIYSIIRDMTAKGMAVILVSSDLPELIGMCDRIAVLRDGALAEIVDASGLREDDLLNRCYGRLPTAA